MSAEQDDPLKFGLQDITACLAKETDPFITFFRRGDTRLLLFAPKNEDIQTPHTQDEIYVIASGTGTFRRGEEMVTFVPGDMLFVAAHVPHRFENFSDDFSTWVIFFGSRT